VKVSAPKADEADQSLYIGLAFFGLAIVLAIMSFLLSQRSRPSTLRDPSSVNREGVLNDKINRYLQETARRRELTKMDLELEGEKVKSEFPSDSATYSAHPVPEESKSLGVFLDQEDSAGKVYKDLYGRNDSSAETMLPEERINMRIAQRKWINELEMNQRRQFINNFLKSARDAGYDLELNENLVVVKVKKLQQKPRIPLDKVLERLSQQGL
jgi:hypothetical protein